MRRGSCLAGVLVGALGTLGAGTPGGVCDRRMPACNANRAQLCMCGSNGTQLHAALVYNSHAPHIWVAGFRAKPSLQALHVLAKALPQLAQRGMSRQVELLCSSDRPTPLALWAF